MSDCEHLNHPEHWPGDAGDIIDSLAPTRADILQGTIAWPNGAPLNILNIR